MKNILIIFLFMSGLLENHDFTEDLFKNNNKHSFVQEKKQKKVSNKINQKNNDYLSKKNKLQKVLDKEIKTSNTNGAVLLAETSQNKWILASGYANKEQKINIKINDRFRIASMSKTFVAATILKLAEEGKINLDKNLTDYFL